MRSTKILEKTVFPVVFLGVLLPACHHLHVQPDPIPRSIPPSSPFHRFNLHRPLKIWREAQEQKHIEDRGRWTRSKSGRRLLLMTSLTGLSMVADATGTWTMVRKDNQPYNRYFSTTDLPDMYVWSAGSAPFPFCNVSTPFDQICSASAQFWITSIWPPSAWQALSSTISDQCHPMLRTTSREVLALGTIVQGVWFRICYIAAQKFHVWRPERCWCVSD